jgi:hypothetical protein
MEALLRAALSPTSRRVTAVGTARSHNLRGTQVSICKAYLSASLSTRNYSSPSVLKCTRLPIPEAAIVVGPFHSALS